MLLATAEAMAEKGFAATSVADVLRRAGVSRETFYQQFDSKLDCFLAAFDAAGELVADGVAGVAGVADAAGSAGARHERLGVALATYLDVLAANLPFARLFLVESYAAGPEAYERRTAVQQRFAERIATLFGAEDDRERFACEAFVALVASLVTGPVLRNDPDALRALHGPLLDVTARLLP
jgi:AcrR family transcriptional regulator